MSSLPTFLCIGAQKSGTTWLHNMLRQHPDLFLPEQKELMFFDVRKNFEKLGIDGYSKCFSEAEPEQTIGEVTPGYLWTGADKHFKKGDPKTVFRRDTPRRAFDILGPELKLILILRDPVDRAISAFFHHYRKGRVIRANRTTFERDANGIIDMGHYYRHIKNWKQYFPKKNFFIITYEELFRDPQYHLENIFDFLGVSGSFNAQHQEEYYNSPNAYELREDGYWLTHCSKLQEIPTEGPHIPTKALEYLKTVYARSAKSLKRHWGVKINEWESISF